MNKIGKIILSCALTLAVVFFSACSSDQTNNLTFSELSTATLGFDTDVRPFLSTLEYSVTNESDRETLGIVSSTITGLSYEMGESFKSLNSAFAELSASADENTTIESSPTEIKIITGGIKFLAKMNESRDSMSVMCESSDKEYVYEVVKSEAGYMAQIATKNEGLQTFTVYQLAFSGTKGVLGIGFAQNKYVSIFGADIAVENFPSVSEKIYRV